MKFKRIASTAAAIVLSAAMTLPALATVPGTDVTSGIIGGGTGDTIGGEVKAPKIMMELPVFSQSTLYFDVYNQLGKDQQIISSDLVFVNHSTIPVTLSLKSYMLKTTAAEGMSAITAVTGDNEEEIAGIKAKFVDDNRLVFLWLNQVEKDSAGDDKVYYSGIEKGDLVYPTYVKESYKRIFSTIGDTQVNVDDDAFSIDLERGRIMNENFQTSTPVDELELGTKNRVVVKVDGMLNDGAQWKPGDGISLTPVFAVTANVYEPKYGFTISGTGVDVDNQLINPTTSTTAVDVVVTAPDGFVFASDHADVGDGDDVTLADLGLVTPLDANLNVTQANIALGTIDDTGKTVTIKLTPSTGGLKAGKIYFQPVADARSGKSTLELTELRPIVLEVGIPTAKLSMTTPATVLKSDANAGFDIVINSSIAPNAFSAGPLQDKTSIVTVSVKNSAGGAGTGVIDDTSSTGKATVKVEGKVITLHIEPKSGNEFVVGDIIEVEVLGGAYTGAGTNLIVPANKFTVEVAPVRAALTWQNDTAKATTINPGAVFATVTSDKEFKSTLVYGTDYTIELSNGLNVTAVSGNDVTATVSDGDKKVAFSARFTAGATTPSVKITFKDSAFVDDVAAPLAPSHTINLSYQ